MAHRLATPGQADPALPPPLSSLVNHELTLKQDELGVPKENREMTEKSAAEKEPDSRI